MANGGQRKTRSERVAALELPPGRLERVWIGICHRDVLTRMAMAFVAAAAVCIIIQAWDPPLHWRTGTVHMRYVASRVNFQRVDHEATLQAEQKRRDETMAVFNQDTKPLEQLRALLRTTIADLTKAEMLTDATRKLWSEFQPPRPDKPEKGAAPPKPADEAATFKEFRTALAGKDNLDQLDHAVAEAFAPLEQHGLLSDPLRDLKDYNKKTIVVYPDGDADAHHEVEVSDVVIDPDAIKRKLADGLASKGIADRIYAWLEPRLLHPSTPFTTLTFNAVASKQAQEENAKIDPVMFSYHPGDSLIKRGESIDGAKLELLKEEYAAILRGPLRDRTDLPRRRCSTRLSSLFSRSAAFICGRGSAACRRGSADLRERSRSPSAACSLARFSLSIRGGPKQWP